MNTPNFLRVEAGEIPEGFIAWRTDITGQQWARRAPLITGVPEQDDYTAEDDTLVEVEIFSVDDEDDEDYLL